ncbi:hypothetical protein AVEN_41600-1 [Araneus ventricosus]|uniref:Uncharacterized protein n=1 Tax=Araneus ventricosus TaxID=182803 RepID=A0A4Y2KLB0_ARAVE|nr:hypothetical protein AVEN_41600-1 [Araneus ventricosus]
MLPWRGEALSGKRKQQNIDPGGGGDSLAKQGGGGSWFESGRRSSYSSSSGVTPWNRNDPWFGLHGTSLNDHLNERAEIWNGEECYNAIWLGMVPPCMPNLRDTNEMSLRVIA